MYHGDLVAIIELQDRDVARLLRPCAGGVRGEGGCDGMHRVGGEGSG